jgi:hypothetical protein
VASLQKLRTEHYILDAASVFSYSKTNDEPLDKGEERNIRSVERILANDLIYYFVSV